MEDQAEMLKNYMDSLKSRKEDFVTGLAGSSIEEINYVTAISLVVYVASKVLKLPARNGSVKDSKSATNMVLDFCLNWIVLLLAVTLYSNNVQLLYRLVLIPIAAVPFLANNKKSNTEKKGKKGAHSKNKSKSKHTNTNADDGKDVRLVKKSFITAYRSHMLVLTAIAILAVDFKIFPRKFGKVETWGTSLMDLGVGSFVFSNGVVSARTLINENLKLKPKVPYYTKVAQSLRNSAVLLALGLMRLFFVKNLEYQEHVTEYGVHWNFFMTLSLLPAFLVLVIDPIIAFTRLPRFVIATLITLTTEYLLAYKDGVLSFLITADRADLISANREGLWSFLGYCSIFLWGQTTGLYTLTNIPYAYNLFNVSNRSLQEIQKKSQFYKLTTVTPIRGLSTWIALLGPSLSLLLKYGPFSCSRRFANLPYVIWVVTYNVCAIFCYAVIDHVFNMFNSENSDLVSESLEAINSNGLMMFLVSNIATGLTNMLSNTLDASPLKAFIILFLYCLVLYTVSIILYRYKIYIRF